MKTATLSSTVLLVTLVFLLPYYNQTYATSGPESLLVPARIFFCFLISRELFFLHRCQEVLKILTLTFSPFGRSRVWLNTVFRSSALDRNIRSRGEINLLIYGISFLKSIQNETMSKVSIDRYLLPKKILCEQFGIFFVCNLQNPPQFQNFNNANHQSETDFKDG